MPRTRDLAIFVTTTDDGQTKLIALPLAHARGVIIIMWTHAYYIHVHVHVHVVGNATIMPRLCIDTILMKQCHCVYHNVYPL